MRAFGTGLSERGGWRGLKSKAQTGKFTRLIVQVMYRNPPTGTTAAPVQYAQGGYEASFGTYEIDESTYTFTFHVEGALVRTLIGKDLPRAFEFSGKQLIVKSTRPEEHWRVAWEHY
jgi:hypothetical protein